MTYNYSKLKGRMAELNYTQEKLAAEMGISARSLSLKLNGIRTYTQRDIVSACEALEIPHEEIPIYFFTPLVQQAEQPKGG